MNTEDDLYLKPILERIFKIVENKWYPFQDFNTIVLYYLKEGGIPITPDTIPGVIQAMIDTGLVETRYDMKEIKFGDFCYD